MSRRKNPVFPPRSVPGLSPCFHSATTRCMKDVVRSRVHDLERESKQGKDSSDTSASACLPSDDANLTRYRVGIGVGTLEAQAEVEGR